MAPSGRGSPPTGSARKFIPALVVGAGLYAYHNSFTGPFIFDDISTISNNATIRQLWPLWGAMSPPANSPVTGRPVVNLSLAVNYALGGLDVWGYHAVNLAIHILAALVLYGVVRRTLLCPSLREQYGAEAPWLALAVALIWVVHPLQTESVTYITQRTESLMALFFLLTLYCVIRGVESSHPGPWYAAAVVSTGLGMGSKEVMVVAPLVVLAYDRLFLSKSFQETFRQRPGLYTGLAACWVIFAALAQARVGKDVARLGLSEVTQWEYAKTQAGVIVHYLRLAFWPHPLVGDYDDWPLAKSVRTILPSAGVVMTFLGVTLWALYRRLRLAFLGVWVFLILAPTSSFYPIVTEVAAERRMYLPLAGVIALVVICGHAVLREVCRRLGRQALQRVLGAAVLVAIVATLTPLTLRRNEDYRSTASFWSDVVAKRPNNARARVGLGASLRRQGRLDEAMAHYSEALRINPQYAEAHAGLGAALSRQGRLDEAMAHYMEALRISPHYALGHFNLGTAYASLGKLDDAIAYYSSALRIDPNYADAHINLAGLLARQGKLKEAISHYSQALRIAPSVGAYYNLGAALALDGRTQEAIQQLQAALKLDPGFDQARRALAGLTSSGAR